MTVPVSRAACSPGCSGDGMAQAQFFIFLGAVRLGAVLALAYGVPAALRRAFSLGRGWVSLLDLLYFFAVGLVSFLYLLSTLDGELRAFVLVGEILGALVVRYSVYSPLVHVLSRVFGILRRVLHLPLSLLHKSCTLMQKAAARAVIPLKNAIKKSQQM